MNRTYRNQLRNFDNLFEAFNRRNIGFDWLPTAFEDLANSVPSVTFPPYDIEKVAENDYQVKMALAGYKPEDIEVTVENDVITVSSGNANSENPTSRFIYKGIAKRSFTQSFKLGENMEVTGAKFDNGLLVVSIVRNIPEEKLPRRIPIMVDNNGEGETQKIGFDETND